MLIGVYVGKGNKRKIALVIFGLVFTLNKSRPWAHFALSLYNI